MDHPKLGERSIDQSFPYERARAIYTRDFKHYITFIPTMRQYIRPKPFPYSLCTKTLTPCQREALKTIHDIIKHSKRGDHKLVFISGAGGVGKTATLISTAKLLRQYDIPFQVISAVASNCHAIGGITAHSFLGWHKIKQSYKELIKEHVPPRVRERISQTKWLLCDEISLFVCQLFYSILARIWFVKSKSPPAEITINNLPVTIVAFGDFLQLANPFDYILCGKPREDHGDEIKSALEIFKNAHYVKELVTNVRQQDDLVLQRILTNIRHDCVNQQDVASLQTRLTINLSSDEIESFSNSIHIYSSNSLCEQFHEKYLSTKDIPIKRVNPELSIDCSDCRKLYRPVFLGKGVDVTLTRNLLTAACITNGASATVVDLFYISNDDNLPAFVTLKFKSNYCGTKLDEDGSVAITYQREFCTCPHFNKKYSVKFYTLTNGNACTTYKIQSKTLTSAWCCFKGYKFKSKEIYVALSRVKRLDQLVIESDKPLEDYFF